MPTKHESDGSTVNVLKPAELVGLRRLGWTNEALNKLLPSEARVTLQKKQAMPGSKAFLKRQVNPLTGTKGVEGIVGDFSNEAIAERNKDKDPPSGVEVLPQRTETVFVRESEDPNEGVSGAMERLREGFEHLPNEGKRLIDGTSDIIDREFNRRETEVGKVAVETMPNLVDEWMKKNADSISHGKGTVFENAAKKIMAAHPELAFRYVDDRIAEGIADVPWTPYEGPASNFKRVVVGQQTLCYIPRKVNERILAAQDEENRQRFRTVADEHRRARHADDRLGSDDDRKIDNVRVRRGEVGQPGSMEVRI